MHLGCKKLILLLTMLNAQIQAYTRKMHVYICLHDLGKLLPFVFINDVLVASYN